MAEKITGVCGGNVTWELDMETGKMVISGCGPMQNYEPTIFAPWADYREAIKNLVVEEGVTTLGEHTFFKCVNLQTVSLPSTVGTLGFHSLSHCSSLKEIELPEGVRVLESRAFDACTSLEKIKFPLSLKAIDLKCFINCSAIREVVYAGTEEAWNRIRISDVGYENRFMLEAPRMYEGKVNEKCETEPADCLWFREKKEVVPVLDEAREILKKGGDGRFHILSLEIRVDSKHKHKSGDCTLLIFPDGKTMLVDVGVDLDNVRDKILAALRRLELKSVDYFVTSHAHADHIGNGLTVAKHIYDQGGTIGTYYFIDIRSGLHEPPFSDYLKEKGVNMQNHSKAGDVWQLGDVKMEIFGPEEEHVKASQSIEKFTAEKMNNLSLVLKFSWEQASYLTSGDLMRAQERIVIGKYGDKLQAKVMKANHHGIVTSSCDEWFDTIKPCLVIADTDDFGGTTLVERLKKREVEYFTTGLNGTILISMDRDGSVEAKTEYGDVFGC